MPEIHPFVNILPLMWQCRPISVSRRCLYIKTWFHPWVEKVKFSAVFEAAMTSICRPALLLGSLPLAYCNKSDFCQMLHLGTAFLAPVARCAPPENAFSQIFMRPPPQKVGIAVKSRQPLAARYHAPSHYSLLMHGSITFDLNHIEYLPDRFKIKTFKSK